MSNSYPSQKCTGLTLQIVEIFAAMKAAPNALSYLIVIINNINTIFNNMINIM